MATPKDEQRERKERLERQSVLRTQEELLELRERFESLELFLKRIFRGLGDGLRRP